MPRNILVLAFFLIMTCLSAQEAEPEDASVNSQIWFDYNSKYELNDKNSIGGFAGYRTINPHLFDKFVVVPTYDILHTKSPKFMKLEEPLTYFFIILFPSILTCYFINENLLLVLHFTILKDNQ